MAVKNYVSNDISIKTINSDSSELKETIKSSDSYSALMSKGSSYSTSPEILDISVDSAQTLEDFKKEIEVQNKKTAATFGEELKNIFSDMPSKLSEVVSFWKNSFSNIDKMTSNLVTILKRTGATVSKAAISGVEGILKTGENLVDASAVVLGTIKSIPALIKDIKNISKANFTFENFRNNLKNTKAFVQKDYVGDLFDSFYENNSIGKALDENAYFSDTTRDIGKAVGEAIGTVGLTLGTFGLGSGVVTARQLGTIASISGFGGGVETAWNNDLNTIDGIKYGLFKGALDGLCFYLGSKITGIQLFKPKEKIVDGVATKVLSSPKKFVNSAIRVGLHSANGAARGLLTPILDLIGQKDDITILESVDSPPPAYQGPIQRYQKAFQEHGGWNSVLTGAILAGGLSTVGELTGATSLFKVDKKKFLSPLLVLPTLVIPSVPDNNIDNGDDDDDDSGNNIPKPQPELVPVHDIDIAVSPDAEEEENSLHVPAPVPVPIPVGSLVPLSNEEIMRMISEEIQKMMTITHPSYLTNGVEEFPTTAYPTVIPLSNEEILEIVLGKIQEAISVANPSYLTNQTEESTPVANQTLVPLSNEAIMNIISETVQELMVVNNPSYLSTSVPEVTPISTSVSNEMIIQIFLYEFQHQYPLLNSSWLTNIQTEVETSTNEEIIQMILKKFKEQYPSLDSSWIINLQSEILPLPSVAPIPTATELAHLVTNSDISTTIETEIPVSNSFNIITVNQQIDLLAKVYAQENIHSGYPVYTTFEDAIQAYIPICGSRAAAIQYLEEGIASGSLGIEIVYGEHGHYSTSDELVEHYLGEGATLNPIKSDLPVDQYIEILEKTLQSSSGSTDISSIDIDYETFQKRMLAAGYSSFIISTLYILWKYGSLVLLI